MFSSLFSFGSSTPSTPSPSPVTSLFKPNGSKNTTQKKPMFFAPGAVAENRGFNSHGTLFKANGTANTRHINPDTANEELIRLLALPIPPEVETNKSLFEKEKRRIADYLQTPLGKVVSLGPYRKTPLKTMLEPIANTLGLSMNQPIVSVYIPNLRGPFTPLRLSSAIGSLFVIVHRETHADFTNTQIKQITAHLEHMYAIIQLMQQKGMLNTVDPVIRNEISVIQLQMNYGFSIFENYSYLEGLNLANDINRIVNPEEQEVINRRKRLSNSMKNLANQMSNRVAAKEARDQAQRGGKRTRKRVYKQRKQRK